MVLEREEHRVDAAFLVRIAEYGRAGRLIGDTVVIDAQTVGSRGAVLFVSGSQPVGPCVGGQYESDAVIGREYGRSSGLAAVGDFGIIDQLYGCAALHTLIEP